MPTTKTGPPSTEREALWVLIQRKSLLGPNAARILTDAILAAGFRRAGEQDDDRVVMDKAGNILSRAGTHPVPERAEPSAPMPRNDDDSFESLKAQKDWMEARERVRGAPVALMVRAWRELTERIVREEITHAKAAELFLAEFGYAVPSPVSASYSDARTDAERAAEPKTVLTTYNSEEDREALAKLIGKNLDLSNHPDSMIVDLGPCPGCLSLADAVLKAGYRRPSEPLQQGAKWSSIGQSIDAARLTGEPLQEKP